MAWARIFTDSGVHVEVLEEDLRGAGVRSTALGVVLGLDVDGRGDRSHGVIKGGSLTVGAGDTVALGLGGLDDELQVGDIDGDAGSKNAMMYLFLGVIWIWEYYQLF